MRAAAWLVSLCLSAAGSSGSSNTNQASAHVANSHLAQAERLVGNLQYSEAAKALAKAQNDSGNDRPTLIRILELTATVEASVGHRDACTEAFKRLLSVAPDYKLGDDVGPKVRTPYYEAKGWIGDHGSLRFAAEPPQVEPGKVLAVRVSIGQDALHLAKSVRFHFLGRENPQVVPVIEGAPVLAPAPPQASVAWWAELLGGHDEVLEQVGASEGPLQADAGPGLAAAPLVPARDAAADKSTTPAAPASEVAAGLPRAEPTLRPLAYGLAGGGAVAVAVGAVFGAMQHGDQNQLSNAARNSAGQVTGLTQKAALSLQSSANADGLAADVLLAAGAVAIAAGVGVWIWGSPSSAPAGSPAAGSASLAVSVAPAGLLAAGTFP